MTDDLDPYKYKAVIFDMDGVITRSAHAHFMAWKKMFDSYLKSRAQSLGTEFTPFTQKDYNEYVDGKPRYDGARSFLESRGIHLPMGSPQDPPEAETISGLGNRKNRFFLEHIEQNGVESYPSSVSFIKSIKALGKRVAVITSSRNGRQVLEAAGVSKYFDATVTGVEAAKLKLNGKPAPDIFLEAAKELGVSPPDAVVIEDALSGVEAGRAGGFGLVIGVNRSNQRRELKEHGANIVVSDLSELIRSSD